MGSDPNYYQGIDSLKMLRQMGNSVVKMEEVQVQHSRNHKLCCPHCKHIKFFGCISTQASTSLYARSF